MLDSKGVLLIGIEIGLLVRLCLAGTADAEFSAATNNGTDAGQFADYNAVLYKVRLTAAAHTPTCVILLPAPHAHTHQTSEIAFE